MGGPIPVITIAFALGIVAAKNLTIPIIATVVCLLIFGSLTVMAVLRKYDLILFLLALCFFAGCFAYQVRNIPSANDLNRYVDQGYVTLTGQIDDEPKQKEGKIIFPLQAEKPANGLVYVTIPADNGTFVYGDRVEVRGVISEAQQFANPLLPEGRKVLFLRSFYAKKLGSGGDPLKKLTLWLSGRFNTVLNQILPQKEASLLGSFLLGSKVSPLDDETKERYRQAGLIHLLVVSGTQVSILIGVCLVLTSSVGLPVWLSVTITSFFNFLLVILTGAGASIVRAAIMGEVMLVGLLVQREKEVYTSLALSALILLVADANVLFDLGFQLSFAATWALVYIAPVLQKKMPQMLAISLAPILATSPIIAFTMSQITPGALLSNLLVLPWVECLVILGLATTLLGCVFMPLAQLLGNAVWLALVALDKIAALVALLPGAYFYLAPPSVPIVLGYYVGLIALVEELKRAGRLVLSGKRLLPIAGAIILIAVWHLALTPVKLADKQLTVTFIDVGQGDCCLLETPGGKKILIDGGGNDGRGTMDEGRESKGRGAGVDGRVTGDGRRRNVGDKIVLPFLRRKGINRLNLIILTHPHEDHLGGLIPVIDKIKVDRVIDGNSVYQSRSYQVYRQLIKQNRIKHSVVSRWIDLPIDNEVKGYLYCSAGNQNVNNDSVVFRLIYGNSSFLFVGDLEIEGEEQLLSMNRSVKAKVLKIGHHGSRTATSQRLLNMVRPQYAVISVGKNNRYKHPHRETIERLFHNGIKYYRTDIQGAVVFTSNGRELVAQPTRGDE